MRCTLSRCSESATVARMWSGRLSKPVDWLPSKWNPNLVAMTTWSRTGASALPTNSSFDEGPVDLCGVEEGNAEVDGGTDEGDPVLLVDVEAVGVAEAHAAQADGGYFKPTGAEGARDHGA